MITNTNDKVREVVQVAGPVAGAAVKSELFEGIDVAAAKHVVTRFVPAEGAKPAEGMGTDTLFTPGGPMAQGWRAGALRLRSRPDRLRVGAPTHRRRRALLVVRLRRLERYGGRRKTDPADSRQLAEDLAHHVAGRSGLLIPVRVPSVEEELRRLPVREREALAQARQQLLRSAKGRALALGYHLRADAHVLPQNEERGLQRQRKHDDRGSAFLLVPIPRPTTRYWSSAGMARLAPERPHDLDCELRV